MTSVPSPPTRNPSSVTRRDVPVTASIMCGPPPVQGPVAAVRGSILPGRKMAEPEEAPPDRRDAVRGGWSFPHEAIAQRGGGNLPRRAVERLTGPQAPTRSLLEHAAPS